jgi:hypothetical protein
VARVSSRLWTVDEANAALERVGATVARIQATAAAARTRQQDLDERSPGNGHAPGGGEVERVRAEVAALAAEGIVLRDVDRGLIDFDAQTGDGRRYWLCWLPGEPEVAWWHWPEDGFAGRTPIAEPPT